MLLFSFDCYFMFMTSDTSSYTLCALCALRGSLSFSDSLQTLDLPLRFVLVS